MAVAVAGALSATLTGSARTAGQCAPGQFLAEYFDGQGHRVFTRCESARIDHNWGTGGPEKGGSGGGKADGSKSLTVGTDHFSVTWTGHLRFRDGTYTFIAVADDGIKVTVDDEVLINEWRRQSATEFRKQKQMTAGLHTVKVEYYEEAEAALVKFHWERSSP